MVRQYNTVSTLWLGQNRIVHNLQTRSIVVQCRIGTNMLNFETIIVSNNEIDIVSYHEQPLTNVYITVLGQRHFRSIQCDDENYLFNY